MTRPAAIDGERIWNWLRAVGWGAAAVLLVLPLIAMRFTSEVHWTLSDFLVMGALLGGAGGVLELATRRSDSLYYRFAATLAVAACFLLVWANGAVGMLGDEGNPANLMFLGVIAVAVIGAVAARARAAGMARVMTAATAAQLAAGIVGFSAGWASPGAQGIYEVVIGTTMFSAMWLGSAFLFGRSAREDA